MAKIIDKVHEATGKREFPTISTFPTKRHTSGAYGNMREQGPEEEFSLVYPTKDDEEPASRPNDPYGYDNGNEEQIDNKINSLTFAFGHRK